MVVIFEEGESFMEETRKSSIVRDLIIKIFLILLFVFLITILFPMPNLTAFYDSVFNNNVQSMKDAADSYFTKDRMPEKVGDSVKLTLQDMLDKKLILPFLDKDGNECDTKKSYVKVTILLNQLDVIIFVQNKQ